MIRSTPKQVFELITPRTCARGKAIGFVPDLEF